MDRPRLFRSQTASPCNLSYRSSDRRCSTTQAVRAAISSTSQNRSRSVSFIRAPPRSVESGKGTFYFFSRSGQHFPDDASVDVGEAEVAALKLEGQPLVVDAEEVQDRGLEVVDVNGILGNVVGEVVGDAE